MTGKDDDELRALLCGIACHADGHFGRASTDLAQLDVLLQQAIAKLCASFITMHAVNQKQQAQLAMHIDTKQAPEFAMLASEMAAALDSAMTGLQFQDLSAQLIASIICRIKGVQKIVDTAAARHCSPVSDNATPSPIASRLDAIASQSDELTRGTPQSVQQQHMESGEIELF